MFFKHRGDFLALILFCIFLSANAHAVYQTNLSFSGYIQDSSGIIDVGLFSAPVVYDWDSDGKNDLLVGQRYDDADSHGYVSFFKNVGTNISPSFTSASYIQACNNTCTLDVAAGG